MPKLASEEFVKYLKQFDIVCLTETFLIGCVQMNSLSDFMTFSEQAKNKQPNKTNKNLKQKSTHPHTPTRTNAKQGRPSGGTKVLIRKPIADSFHNITIRYGNMLAFNVPRKKKKKALGTNRLDHAMWFTFHQCVSLPTVSMITMMAAIC